MPAEVTQLQHADSPLEWCPRCRAPFEPFLRGQVQRWHRKWLIGPPRPYCALICRACKDIVAYESPAGGDIELA